MLLEAASKNKETVKRVVVTGSFAAILNFNSLGVLEGHKDPNKLYNESDWNLSSNLNEGPYRYGKRLRYSLSIPFC